MPSAKDKELIVGRKKYSFLSINPNKGLSGQFWLWAAIMCPLFTCLVLGLFIWKDYSLLLSAKGYEEFLKISALPLAIGALSLPLAAFVASLHSTRQTAKQIQQAATHNNFTAYYSHRESLSRFFSDIRSVSFLDKVVVNYKVHPGLHSELFHGSPHNGYPNVNHAFFIEVEGKMQVLANLIFNLVLGKYDARSSSDYVLACELVYILADKIMIAELVFELKSESRMVEVCDEEKTFAVWLVGDTPEHLIAAFRCIYSYYINLCRFAGREAEFKVDKFLDLFMDVGVNHLQYKNTIPLLHMDFIDFKVSL